MKTTGINLLRNHFGQVKPVTGGSDCVSIPSVVTRFPFKNQKIFTWEECFSLSCQPCFLSRLMCICDSDLCASLLLCNIACSVSGGRISCTGRCGYCSCFIGYFGFLWNIGTYCLKEKSNKPCKIFLTWKTVEHLRFLVITMISDIAN